VHVSMGMDKYRHVYSFNKSPHGKEEYYRILEFVNYTCTDGSLGGIFEGGKSWKHKSHAWSYGKVFLEGTRPLVVGCGYTPTGHRSTFDFNPSKITGYGLAKLKVALDLSLYTGLDSLLAYGNVGYTEIAVDITGLAYADYFFVDRRLRSDFAYYEPNGTTYLSSNLAARGFSIYAKDKQMSDVFGVAATEPILRVEARLRPRTHVRLDQLPAIGNPFEHLLLISKHALMAPNVHFELVRFRKAIVEQGLSAQRAYQAVVPKHPQERRNFIKRLAALAPEAWNAASIWAKAPNLLDWLKL
jgi:hypothetical protein